MLKYWVWLSYSLEPGSAHLKPLLERFKSVKAIYDASISDLKASYILSPSELKRFNNKALDKAFRIIEECNESKINIVSFDDSKYPERLKEIPDPPPCLYVKGVLQDYQHHPIVCIVGTRKVSDYGKLVAWSLSGRLAAGGITVLSGGALGADTEAHEGAMMASGKTIAVIPCGLNYNYLKSNMFLRGSIQDKGCLISELPPDTPLPRNAFQIRNRLMSAISLGVVVVEAGEKSGALITARHALEQGRDVFAVTGRAGDKNYVGSNALLRDGAKPVFTADDIFCEYEHLYPNIINVEKAKKADLNLLYRMSHFPKMFDTEPKKLDIIAETEPENKKIKKKINETLPKYAEIVYNYIDTDLFTADDLINCGLPFEEILSGITQLELYGYIKALPGGRYTII